MCHLRADLVSCGTRYLLAALQLGMQLTHLRLEGFNLDVMAVRVLL